MKDLSKAHVDEYKSQQGIMHLRDGDSDWLIGDVGGVTVKLDPMQRIRVSGTYADGTTLSPTIFEVPFSIALKGAVPIMEYITEHYAQQPATDTKDYTENIKQLITSILRESWMSDADWAEVEALTLSQAGLSYEQMNVALHVGIRNGYSAEVQFALMRQAMKEQKGRGKSL